MKIDSHQHFWKYSKKKHAWINEEMKVLQSDFLPKDLKPLLDDSNIGGCVAVQADQSLAENKFLLGLAKKNDWIQGVVGWVDLNSHSVESDLEKYKSESKFVGVRHILQDEEADFMLTKSFNRGVSALKYYDLTYDVLIYENQMEAAIEFVRRHPYTRMVLDHMAKPLIKEGLTSPWEKYLKEMGQMENLFVKMSGWSTEADWGKWTPEDIAPYLEICLESFGPERIMYGSDWPVSNLATEYSEVVGVVENFISTLSVDEQDAIFGNNAMEFYSL